MQEHIILNLRDRLKALEDAVELDDKDFAMAAFEYAAYIGSTKELSGIVKELASTHDIDRKIFYRLFMYSAIRNGFRNKHLDKPDIGMPLFYDEEIEEEYGLMKEFLEMLMVEDKRLKESKKQNISIFDVALPEDKNDGSGSWMTPQEELFKFRVLHNDIIARATTHRAKGVWFDEKTGILHLGNRQIKFRKFTEQYHCLRIIFSDKERARKECMFSEIAEIMDFDKGYSDKDFHNYFTAIKNRVSADTGIKDLFLTTNQSVRINEQYL